MYAASRTICTLIFAEPNVCVSWILAFFVLLHSHGVRVLHVPYSHLHAYSQTPLRQNLQDQQKYSSHYLSEVLLIRI